MSMDQAPPPLEHEPELPNSVESEEALLGALIVNNRCIPEVSAALDEADFYHRGNGLIWHALLNVHYDAGAVDTTTLVANLRDTGHLEEVGGLFRITNLVTEKAGMPSMVGRSARILGDHSRRRRLITLAAKMQRQAADASNGVDGVVDATFAALVEQFNGTARRDPILIGDALAEARTRIEAAARAGKKWAGLDTGFDGLNEAMNGLCPDELTILGARPGIGKTRLAMQIVRNVITSGQGGALVFSLEMSRAQLVDYLICLETGMDLRLFRRGKLSADDWASYQRAERMIAEWDLVLDDSPALSLPQLYAITERVRRVHKDAIKMVVIDYLQLMTGPGQSGNEKFDRISQGLKDYSKAIGLPVIVLSQCSRNVDTRPDRRPCMADLRDSGQIEANAVNVLMLWRMGAYPELVARTGGANETLCHAVIVADKLRFSSPQEIPILWVPKEAKFAPQQHNTHTGPKARRTR